MKEVYKFGEKLGMNLFLEYFKLLCWFMSDFQMDEMEIKGIKVKKYFKKVDIMKQKEMINKEKWYGVGQGIGQWVK